MAEQAIYREFRRNKRFYTTSGAGRDMACTPFWNCLLTYVLFTLSVPHKAARKKSLAPLCFVSPFVLYCTG